jgi:hypothetical protein
MSPQAVAARFPRPAQRVELTVKRLLPIRVLFVEGWTRLQPTVGTAVRQSGYAEHVSGDGEDGLWRTENHGIY